MPATKSNQTLLALTATATQGTAKAAPALTSTAADLRTAYGAVLTGVIQNGSTGPNAALLVQPQISGDNATWRDYGNPIAGDTLANSVSNFTVELPRAAMYARTIAYGNTVNPVSTSTEIEILTGL